MDISFTIATYKTIDRTILLEEIVKPKPQKPLKIDAKIQALIDEIGKDEPT